MKLWIYTDGTKYSLPLLVELNATTLARKVGVKDQTVRKAAWDFRHGYRKETRYEVVEVEDEDNDL